ncbi:Sucraseferredoxin-like protein [Corchorus olitorius]|uniref:Sucraseferredoxin-like protein n=1 Tax=Corchorus olitorius TaxID=93759 RepID=A0A1R3HG31_9ROSI|nr:Sucraseferredoxin-like protein [Corchorus olitorius]
MADSNNFSTVSAEDDAKFGFTREEMYSSNLAGTVNPYDRHVFLRFKSYTDWAARVEEDQLPKILSSALKARKADIPLKTLLTVIEGGETDGDVLIFPDMIKYKGLTDSDVDGFVEDALVNGKPWDSRVPETLTGSYVFVCAHGSRDKRCGVCGPALIEKFNAEIESRGLKDQVFVSACSHIGGHKYAGNLIIYSPDSEGKLMGHWYGYVTPSDVPELLDQHIAKGQIIERLWRGQLGGPTEGGDKTNEQKLPNGTKHEESTAPPKTNENTGGCCQGVNGVSCCMTASSEVSERKVEEKGEANGKTGLGKLKCWADSWEQRDVLTAAAVIGAVATIAVAYSYYRRSG